MTASPAMTVRQGEAFDRLLDVIAEAVVEQYLAQLEGADTCGTVKGVAE